MATGARVDANNVARLSEASRFFSNEDSAALEVPSEDAAEDSTTEKVGSPICRNLCLEIIQV